MDIRPLLCIGLIVATIAMIRLRGKLLQNTWDSISSAVRQKRQKMESVRQLSNGHISSVCVKFAHRKGVDITNAEKIQEFKNCLSYARICKIKDKDIPERLELVVNTAKGGVRYDTFLSGFEKTDAFFELLPGYDKYAVRLPGLKCWLDENVLSKQKSEPVE